MGIEGFTWQRDQTTVLSSFNGENQRKQMMACRKCRCVPLQFVLEYKTQKIWEYFECGGCCGGGVHDGWPLKRRQLKKKMGLSNHELIGCYWTEGVPLVKKQTGFGLTTAAATAAS